MLYVLAADVRRDVNIIIPGRNKKKEALICKLCRFGVKKNQCLKKERLKKERAKG